MHTAQKELNLSNTEDVASLPHSLLCIRVVQFGVRSKVWVCELLHIFTNPKSAVRELLKVHPTLCFFHIFHVFLCTGKI